MKFDKVLTSIFLITSLIGCANKNLDISNKKIEVNGVYKALLPCADCDGINATLEINNNKFKLTYAYITPDNETEIQDGFYIIKDNIITTTNLYKEKQEYRIEGDTLIMLDKNGNEINGVLAKKYKFKRQ